MADPAFLSTSNALLLIQSIFSCWAAFVVYKTIAFLKRNRNQSDYMSKASVLSRSSKPGDYVRFSGVLSLPETKTPFSKKSCAYWATTVRAYFQTKQKSPGTGMNTHRPVIHRSQRDYIPFIVNDTQHTVLVQFPENSKRMLNMKQKSTESSSVPESIKEVAKPKYKKYLVDEYWLPLKAMLIVFGTVQSANKNCITLSGSDNEHHFPLIFFGNSKELTNIFKSNSELARLYFIWLLAGVVSIWTWMPVVLPNYQTLVAGVIFIVISFLFLFKLPKNLKLS